MDSSSHHWYVQTDFGALLGPMPDDALAEMARTGALLVRDRVRKGPDGEWCPASEVPGLFEEQTPSLGLLSSTLEDLFAPQAPSPREFATSKRAPPLRPAPNETASASAETNELAIETDAPLIIPLVVTPATLAVNELGFEVDVPLLAPTEASSQSPAIRTPSLLEKAPVPKAAPSQPPAQSAEPASEHIEELDFGSESTNRHESEEVLPSPPGWRPSASAVTGWKPTIRRSALRFRIDKQTGVLGAIVAAVLLLLVTAWSLWPSQRRDLYESYSAIYKELQQRREVNQDFAGWTEFVARATAQLDESLPWLEGRSVPGDQEKSLLFYAGRDLREFVNLPHTARNPHQQRLDVFFEQLQELYASK